MENEKPIPTSFHTETNEQNTTSSHEGYEVVFCKVCNNGTIRAKGNTAETCGSYACSKQ